MALMMTAGNDVGARSSLEKLPGAVQSVHFFWMDRLGRERITGLGSNKDARWIIETSH
jgi:hypothetical protein